MEVHGWGRYPVVDADVCAPHSTVEARGFLEGAENQPLIGRGMGRSYGDSSLAPKIIDTTAINVFLDFDSASGIVRCAAGVTLSDLLDVFVPRGWFPPVTPGTKFVTVAGAIASDVHGKNHHRDGCFSEFVENIGLMLGDGSIVTCSRQQNADLFHATCGGMGLTGLILEATIRMKGIRGSSIIQTIYKARGLGDLLDLFELHRDASYSVAWIDCMASNDSLGRGFLIIGEHEKSGGFSARHKKLPLSVPFDMPAFVLNRHSIKAFNALYYQRIRSDSVISIVHYEPYFYPLDRIRDWNRIYGKDGFVQYQCVLPKTAGLTGLQNILNHISKSQRGSFLAVLKIFGKENDNLLSFPTEGYTLALDFKFEVGILELLNNLDSITLSYGGRVYLAKDARMSAATFKQGYPRWENFQAVRERYRAIGKFASCQSKRLGLD